MSQCPWWRPGVRPRSRAARSWAPLVGEIKVDEFWNLIGSNSIRDDDEIDTVLRRISGQLKAMTPDDLFRFHDQLCEALFVIDRREFAEIPVRLKNGYISEIP